MPWNRRYLGWYATGFLRKSSINRVARWDGLVFGDYHLFVAQLLSIWCNNSRLRLSEHSFVWVLVRLFTKLRVDENSENVGLDDSEHGERAYSAIWE